MANRAYLFRSDEWWDFALPDDDYHDSRHGLPIAWLFFFDAANLMDLPEKGTSSTQLKFTCDAEQALARFADRRSFLANCVSGWVTLKQIVELEETVADRPGRYLLLDPAGILTGMGDDDATHIDRLRAVLAAINAGTSAAEVLEAIRPYCDPASALATDTSEQCLGHTDWPA